MRTLLDDNGIHEATQYVYGQSASNGISFKGGSDQVGDAATRYLAVELRNAPLPCGATPEVVEKHYEQAKKRVRRRIENDIQTGAITFDPVTAITLAYYLWKLFSWLWNWMIEGVDSA